MSADSTEPASHPAPTASEKVWRAIAAGLYEGRFVPGQRLVEADLAEQFKVSRGSVREALSRLTSDGIVTIGRFKGAEIRQLSIAETLDVLVVVEMAVGLAARIAAERLVQSEHAKALEDILTRLESLQDRLDTLDGVRARNSFYRIITAIGGNAELARLLPNLRVHLVRLSYLPQVAGLSGRERGGDYRRIVKAILNRDPKQAEKAARRHVARLIDAIRGQVATPALAVDDTI